MGADARRLEARIRALRGQARRLLALHGLSRVVAVVVPLIVVAGLADWLFHLDSFLRLALLVSAVGAGLWLCARAVVLPLLVRFEDLDIALRIEERWPGLNDRLASTVQFLRAPPDEDRYGSPDLRAATIRQTIAQTATIDFRKAIDSRPTLRALSAASGALLVALAVLATAPHLSTIALRRLLLPFGSDRWPQQTHLTLLAGETPRKIARGDSFTLGVAVGKGEHVPTSAQATYRFADGEVVVEPLRSIEGGVFRGRIETVTKPFTFSVAAGDDATSLRNLAVAVVPPPALTGLKIELVPPRYTGQKPQTLAADLTQVRAVEGTLVALSAVSNKPMKTATLRIGDAGERAPADITFDPSRTRFVASFTVKESEQFWFDLLDAEGFRGREATRYDLRAIHDEAPRVVIDEPVNDRDVPAKAVVPVKFTVDDDFGIQSARLIYKVATGGSEPSQEVALPLFDGRDQPGGPIKHREVTYAWDLAPLKLSPGAIITFHADARDFDDLKGPNLGKSREVRLRILADDDINRQLDDQRREIREETARVLAMQEQAKAPVDDALRTLDQTNALDQAKRDDVKNAEMIQRQVANRVNNRTDGLDQKIKRFLDDLNNFKLPNPDAQKQMERMRAGVAKVREDHLGPAEQGLTHASKRLDEAAAAPPQGRDRKSAREQAQENTKTARADLGEAQQNQKAIVGELKKMLDGLSEFDTIRGIAKDAQQLLKDQEQTMKQTAEQANKPDLMGKTPEALTPEQKADLGNLAAKQNTIGKSLQNFLEKTEKMAQRLDEPDPLAAAALRGAAETSRKQGTAGKMAEAGDQLEKNQMGTARDAQEKVRQELKELVDSIVNRRERELSRLVKELKNAEADLQKLREKQAQNLKKTEDAGKMADPKARAEQLKKLAKEQEDLKTEAQKQLKRLAKLNAESAARAAAKAAGKMAKAQDALDQDQGDQAGAEEEDALADLEDAQKKTKEARKEAEELLAMEQLAKLGDHLKSVAERQAKMVGDTVDFEKLRAANRDTLSIAQKKGVRSLGRIQAGLKDETDELSEKLDGAPVFALTLKRAAEGMSTAAQRLQTLKTDDATQAAERAASNRFKQLLESLRADKPKQGGPRQDDGGGGGGGGGGDGDGIPAAAQVKMLKALQEEINERTDHFDELRRRKHDLSPEQTAELERLHTDQGTLADLTRDLTKPKHDDGED